jgi:hypothetical protein
VTVSSPAVAAAAYVTVKSLSSCVLLDMPKVFIAELAAVTVMPVVAENDARFSVVKAGAREETNEVVPVRELRLRISIPPNVGTLAEDIAIAVPAIFKFMVSVPAPKSMESNKFRVDPVPALIVTPVTKLSPLVPVTVSRPVVSELYITSSINLNAFGKQTVLRSYFSTAVFLAA